VLVLDEATSTLDPGAERVVLDAVRRRAGTTLFVTHREAVAAEADSVAVIEGGRLVAAGPHGELLAMEWYRDLWPGRADGRHPPVAAGASEEGVTA
jgi:ATP-binding cassette, subfamily B, bacterial